MKQLISLLLVLSFFSLFAQTGTKRITLEDVIKNRTFVSKGVSGINSMRDGEHYSQIKKDSLNIYEFETGKLTRTLVTSKDLIPAGDTTPISMGGYTFSQDENKILFSTDEEPLYRHSSKANYYYYDLASGKLTFLSKGGKQRLATFSPDGTKIAFVRDNNIYVVDIITGKEKQITNDGKVNAMINGATDWVYEEEFGFSRAFFWSPDSKKIAYYRFDESNVREYQLTYYGDLYPEHFKYKYPKAGEDNSKISIFIWDVDSGNNKARGYRAGRGYLHTPGKMDRRSQCPGILQDEQTPEQA